ncbi:MAG: calcium/sodium antiporter [Rikenellaceae bacterium]
MTLTILFLIFALALIIAGASFLTDGSVALARKAKVSELAIGLTIVALGTSMPELVVSVVSALKGSSQIALGNVIGSNIMNILVIIGLTSLICPIKLTKENTFFNIPLVILVSGILCVLCFRVLGVDFMPYKISRLSGIFLLLLFGLFLWHSVRSGKNQEEETHQENMPLWKSILTILLGLGALVWGGNLFLSNAVDLAHMFGVSEYVISATIVALGTSLPELATSVVAALKGRSQLALGNVVGSNVANILLVLGATATISPLSLVGLSSIDVLMLFASSVLLFISAFSFKRYLIDRGDAIILLIAYVVYVYYLLA